MKILFGLILILTAGCSTVSSRLVDTNNGTDSQHVIDDRECTKYHWDNGFKYSDTEYYYACMNKRGYKLVTTEE